MGFAQTSVCNKANKKTKGILGHLTDIYTYIQSGKGNKIMQLYLSLDETQSPDYTKV